MTTDAPNPATPGRSPMALARVPLLAGVSADALGALANRCVWQSLDVGRVVTGRDTGDTDVCFVASGAVRVTSFSAAGREVAFQDLEQGAHFGELAAIDGGTRSADVVTLVPSVIARLDREGFLALLASQPEVARRVMGDLCGVVRRLSQRVVELSTLSVQSRLHAELLRRARIAGVAGNRARLSPSPRHLELASQVSTNREQITREMSALTRAGLLAKDGKDLLLPDVARLQAMLAEASGAA